jgi:alpha-1,3-glucosyltransferase
MTKEEVAKALPCNLVLCLFGFVTLLRILVGFHPHSGQDNYHGSFKAYGGDFEAQRHWMELTYHLPIGDWYYYDLEYWGLDYPPLTAYVSYVCGVASHFIVGPESVALETSRSMEDPTHKAFMRATVLFLDLLVYGTAVWYATNRRSLWTILLALVQPAIVLIDHGHFQYNTVALGLSIGAFSYMVQTDFINCIIGSVLFCLALNFKQMTLYYAPAVFCYLLGRCFSQPKWLVLRFLALGVSVIVTFGILWEPFIKYGPSHLSELERLLHVLRRIFPLERGLFEGKVANLWCALSAKPIKIRDRLEPEIQPLVALAATITLMLPACYRMLRLGMETKKQDQTQRHWIQLLWATTSTALAFFLASFQVHEKSILLALAPCALLLWQDPILVDWFSIVCVWTLWPLLQVDRLHVAYVCMVAIFGSLIWCRRQANESVPSVFSGLLGWIPAVSYLGMLGLHLAEIFVPVPSHLPDLFEVLWSVAGCGMFCLSWSITCVKLFQPGVSVDDSKKAKLE